MSDFKEQVLNQYNIIKDAKNKIEDLRKQCKHSTSSLQNYSWRIGSIQERMLCDDCGKPTDPPLFMTELKLDGDNMLYGIDGGSF